MKQFFLSSLLTLFFANILLAEVNPMITPVSQFGQAEEVQALPPDLAQLTIDKFLDLTPAKYKKMTGEKLGIKKTIQLKMAQKALKKQLKKGAELRSADEEGDGITKGIYILLAILGLAWVAMGIKDDWSGSDWVVNLILTILCWLPGLIHALVKMKKYYP